jgi:hypothetical protein
MAVSLLFLKTHIKTNFSLPFFLIVTSAKTILFCYNVLPNFNALYILLKLYVVAPGGTEIEWDTSASGSR